MQKRQGDRESDRKQEGTLIDKEVVETLWAAENFIPKLCRSSFFCYMSSPCVKSIIHGIELSFSHLTNALRKTAIIEDEIIRHGMRLNHIQREIILLSLLYQEKCISPNSSIINEEYKTKTII